MPYIYKITNSINGKCYIGKTSFTISKRWKEHCRDAQKHSTRPLYRAITKYGENNFRIEVIEEVETDELAQKRERFWIQYYASDKRGYNATSGGDGKSYIDTSSVVDSYSRTQNQTETAAELNIHVQSVRNILLNAGIPIVNISTVMTNRVGKRVKMCLLDGTFVQEFASLVEAATYCINQGLSNSSVNTGATHISEVCRNKRKAFAKHKWEFLI